MTWTVADGSKGRRWREAVTDARGIRHSLLFETGSDRRFGHMELASAAGLLTLHPEGDATLHGNLVDGTGVRHIVGLPWDRDAVVDLAGSAITAAAAAWLLDRAPGAREDGIEVAVLRISANLELEVAATTVTPVGDASWRAADGTTFAAGRDGLPVLDAAAEWPLEQDS